ncbi:MAG: hypothetical protein Q8R28_06985, partial [Dehalococcoidia bacterium]|nr:hypothetical protein [Dehalococcoidia bacterium]
ILRGRWCVVVWGAKNLLLPVELAGTRAHHVTGDASAPRVTGSPLQRLSMTVERGEPEPESAEDQ